MFFVGFSCTMHVTKTSSPSAWWSTPYYSSATSTRPPCPTGSPSWPWEHYRIRPSNFFSCSIAFSFQALLPPRNLFQKVQIVKIIKKKTKTNLRLQNQLHLGQSNFGWGGDAKSPLHPFPCRCDIICKKGIIHKWRHASGGIVTFLMLLYEDLSKTVISVWQRGRRVIILKIFVTSLMDDPWP